MNYDDGNHYDSQRHRIRSKDVSSHRVTYYANGLPRLVRTQATSVPQYQYQDAKGHYGGSTHHSSSGNKPHSSKDHEKHHSSGSKHHSSRSSSQHDYGKYYSYEEAEKKSSRHR
ncbi:Uu.00g012060.m01.CDS01 [Anthostomella pinea]|uniref:Uu.00g012060.m01.CDS01 n=1 Tax=Anthostomella pinea TaxID=933095 RepID=A0AAI8VXW4_9PEZI|nr:Uu.00g012060.m01.CDS01 [Anthostomella pinea]